MIHAALCAALLSLPAEAPAVEAAAMADEAADSVEVGTPAVLRIDDVTVTAQPLAYAVGRAEAVPVELRATWEGAAGDPPARVTVRLCSDYNCAVFQVVQMAVGRPDQPAPAVQRRVLADNSQVVITTLDGALSANAVLKAATSQGFVAIVGSLSSPLPNAGWRTTSKYQYQQVQGGLTPAVVTSTLDAYPELVHGYDALVVAPDAKLSALVKTELRRYLRAGGKLLVPDALGDEFRPKADPDADPRSVLEGKAPVRRPARSIVIERAPALVSVDGFVIRDEQSTLTLPVTVAPVHSGLLYRYQPEATGADLVDALLGTNADFATNGYSPGRPEAQVNQLRDGAGVLIAQLPPKGLMAAAIVLWGLILFFSLYATRKRFSWKTLVMLLGGSAVVAGGVLAAGRVVRGEGDEATVRVVNVREGALFGVERGIVLRWASSDTDVELSTPSGTFALPTYLTSRAGAHQVPFRPIANNVAVLSLQAGEPAGLRWSRTVPVTAGLKLTGTNLVRPQPGSDNDLAVKNTGDITFDRVLVVANRGQQLWSITPLAPGESRTAADLTDQYLAQKDPPDDRREAALRRLGEGLSTACPTVEEEGNRPCALGFRFTDDGIDVTIVAPRLGWVFEGEGPAHVAVPVDTFGTGRPRDDQEALEEKALLNEAHEQAEAERDEAAAPQGQADDEVSAP